MEYVVIPAAAFSASVLSFYSGFGLGTLLMPVLAIFFPLPAAIATPAAPSAVAVLVTGWP